MKSLKLIIISLTALLGTAGCVVDVSPGYGYYYESYEYCPPPVRVIHFDYHHHNSYHGYHGGYRRNCR